MLDQFSLKELYGVKLKATQSMEINGRQFDAGETIAYFDSIQLSVIKEDKSYITAHGGFADAPHVWWETTKDVRLQLTKGIVSKTQFALMSNSKMLNAGQDQYLMVPQYDVVESDEYGVVEFPHTPVGKFYMYDYETGQKLNPVQIDITHYNIDNAFQTVVLDYYYDYNNGFSVNLIGWRLFNGWLALEGHTEVQDDVTGQKKTGIIVIPKLKLMSDLSLRLGDNAQPIVGTFNATAVPVGQRGISRIMEMYFLNDNIDSDM